MRLVLPAAIVVVLVITFAFLVFDRGDDSPVLSVAECPPADDLPSIQVQSTTVVTTTPEPTSTLVPPTPPPASTPVPPEASLEGLRTEMARAIDSYNVPGRYAVAVTDLRTGETVSVNGDHPQLAGCSVSFFLLVQVALDLQSGRHILEEVDALVAATTWSSNAATARDLYEIVGDGDPMAGVRRVADLMASLDMRQSVLNHPPLYIELAGSDAVSNVLTAEETNRALLASWQGDLLQESWADYLWAHLSRVKPGLNYLLGILTDVQVSHKNGFFPLTDGYVDNDIGIATWSSDGSQAGFAFSFFSEGIAVKYADIPLGQQLVLMAYRHLAATYPPQ